MRSSPGRCGSAWRSECCSSPDRSGSAAGPRIPSPRPRVPGRGSPRPSTCLEAFAAGVLRDARMLIFQREIKGPPGSAEPGRSRKQLQESDMFRNTFKSIAVIAFLVTAGTVAADVLLIEEVRERMQRDLPDNGLTMSQVEQRYGRPNERRAPVGEPPISRWLYDDYSVYFEHDLVIESVLHRGAVLSGNDPNG